jgi:hypothetical protein
MVGQGRFIAGRLHHRVAVHRTSAILLSLLALVACGRSEPRKTAPQRVTVAVPTGPACEAALRAVGITLLPWAPGSRSCPVDTPVLAPGPRPHLTPALRTSCSLLYVWTTFEPEIDRLARRTMGAGLSTAVHYGSYGCRAMTGNARRRSLHASARALDIAAFELTDGRRISVKRDWRSRGPAAKFLHAVALAGCSRFSAVLTPLTDRLHDDHLHFDIGPWRVCDA